jgi:hypothetical protein
MVDVLLCTMAQWVAEWRSNFLSKSRYATPAIIAYVSQLDIAQRSKATRSTHSTPHGRLIPGNGISAGT